MRPAYQTSLIMLLVGTLVLITAGCGKKHLHVSTMSSAPGEEEVAMATDLTEDQSGLENSGLDESGLATQGEDAADSSTDDLEPLDFTHQTPPVVASQEPEPSSATNDFFTELNDSDASPSAPSQEIQSQSPSLPLLPTDEPTAPTSIDEPLDTIESPSLSNLDSTSQPKEDVTDASEDLPPLVAFNTPDESNSDSLFDLGNSNEETPLPIEQIPGNIAVAKAEPSDAFREQLEKMKDEEAAAIAAGLSDVFFEFDSWTLTSEGRQALEQGAEWLHGKASSKLLVEGHCDSRGTQAYNLVLGKKRAGAIRDYLVELGITPERVSIISYGQDKPFCTDTTEVCYQLNRRGHLLVQNP